MKKYVITEEKLQELGKLVKNLPLKDGLNIWNVLVDIAENHAVEEKKKGKKK